MDIGFECREKRGLLAPGEIFDCWQWLHGGYDMKFLRLGLSGLVHGQDCGVVHDFRRRNNHIYLGLCSHLAPGSNQHLVVSCRLFDR